MAQLKVLTLERLDVIKNYIDVNDAKSLKTVAIDGNKLKFYRVSEPVGDTEAAYEIELPEADLSGVLAKLTGAVEGDVVVANADGTVKDGGVKLTDLALKSEVTAVSDIANANKTAIDEIKNADTGILKTAKDYADEKVKALADGQVATNKADIATMKGQIEALEEGTYDDTELRELIDANADAIEAHKTAIDEKVTTLIGTDASKSVRTIASEELAKQLIPESAKESLDTLEEIATWIQSHPDDASAMNTAIENLKTLVGTLPEDITATTIVGYIQELVNAEKLRIDALETKVGDGCIAISEAEINAMFATS